MYVCYVPSRRCTWCCLPCAACSSLGCVEASYRRAVWICPGKSWIHLGEESFPLENIEGRNIATHQEEAPSTSRDCETVVKVGEKMVGWQKEGHRDTAIEFVAVLKVTLKENIKEYRIGRRNHLQYIFVCLTAFSLFGKNLACSAFLLNKAWLLNIKGCWGFWRCFLWGKGWGQATSNYDCLKVLLQCSLLNTFFFSQNIKQTKIFISKMIKQKFKTPDIDP